MKAVKKDVFDINKVTVVGSPTITSDGVASGFTTSNYITIPMFDVTKPNYRVDCIYNYATGTGQNFFLGGAWNIGPYRFAIISNLNKLALYMGNDETSWNIADLQYGKTILENNTPYKVSFIRENGSAYKVVLKNLNTNVETTEITVSSAEDLVNNINVPIRIGYSGWTPFAGSINLPSFSITVDGELVYSPTRPTTFLERRKEGFDLSKFTVVGSPTITTDGIATGFSGENYLTVTTFNPNTSTWKIKGSFKTPTTLTQVSQKIFGSTLIYDGVNLGIYSNLVQLSASNTGSSMNIIDATSSQTVLPNTLYYYEVVFDGASYKVNLSTDNKNWITYIDKATNLTVNSFTIQMGAFRNGLAPFLGSIDLASILITVDGKEVFTGAKEKFYAIGD